MVEFKLNSLKDNAFIKVTEVIYDYVFSVGINDDFIVRLAVGKNAKTANHINEVAYRYDDSIVFLNNWWQGEPYVAVLGILPVTDVTDFDDIKVED